MSLLMQRRQAPEANINVTSLVDVTMTVLIIFILIAPIIEQGIDVDLPVATAARIEQTPESVTVSLQEIRENGKKIGVIFVGQNRMRGNPYDTLKATLIQMKTKDPKLSVIIRADKDFRYDNVVKILSIVREVGITSLSLATESE
jgi:biopolymer transport protein TolR